ncbi:hypothetical protein [Gimesia sp.]|uniref:hypothetical protein n=1 Tax=Gimesia sp. TaxID=2024833 RepID=UPI0032ED834B
MKYRMCFTLAVLLAGSLLLTGCGYPEVSPKTYELSKTLYSVCNQKSSERLKKVQALIQSSLEQEEITSREADWLNGIIKQAEAGEWDEALRESRQIMEDQAGR